MAHRRSSQSARTWLSLAAAAALSVAGLSVFAQGPAPAPTQPAAGAPAGRGGQGRGVLNPADGAAGEAVPQGRGFQSGPYTADLSPKPPQKVLAPADEQKLFQLQTGYRIELVMADPIIQEPAAITFDGNGRMFVLELRTYMLDADGTNTLTPGGRISRHEDVDGDGTYERHTVFVDNLVFPRFAMPFGGDSVITKNSNEPEVWKYTDTNGDGVADKKEPFTSDFGRGGNVEHQESHLTWAMDNWMYSTYNAVRLRWTPGGVIRESIGNPGGAWGVTQDDDGKVWIQSGASGLPGTGSLQVPLAYGNITIPDQLDPELRTTWGAPVRIADMQPGMGSIRMPDGSLHSSTAGAGGDIFRGHRLPDDLKGDYLYGEVVARIVRRIKPEVREGLTHLKNYYSGNEFIRQTDPMFRPTDQVTAPDGTLYIADMYHGIIQESQWTPRGSYLRAKIDQYQLDKVIHRGRIWRLKYDGMDRDRTQPRMLNETPAQLVAKLSHPNGWWRDTAQQLLVLKQDKSVVPALQQLVRTSPNLLARFHSMWVLEGLGALDPALVRQQMKDPSPRMRIQAIRASESLYKKGDRSFAADYRTLSADTDTSVVMQSLLTANVLKMADAPAIIRQAQAGNKARGVQEVATQLLNRATNAAAGANANRSAEDQAVMARGEAIYKELCSSCHGEDARGALREGAPGSAPMAPPLAGSPRVTGHRDYTVKALLHGMTGPIAGQTYTEVMVPMGTNQDEWVASIASYVRNAFGNSGTFVSNADVARVRAATTARRTSWTVTELEASLPRALAAQADWKATSSHNPTMAGRGLTFAGWTSQAPQQPGMWLQVELPQAVTMTEVQFASAGGGGGGGGGGRGAAPAAGRGAAGAGAAAQPAPAPAPPAALPAFPRGYRVQVSTDGTNWTSVSEGQGRAGTIVATFAPVQARFVRITQTATPEGAPTWSMQNLRIFEASQPTAR